MQLWNDNKKDQPWEVADKLIARQFLASPFADLDRYPGAVESMLHYFIGAPIADGGLQSVCVTSGSDPDAAAGKASFDHIVEMVQGERGKSYPYLRAWGRWLSSGRDYINEQIALAREDWAPDDVIYANLEEWEERGPHPAAADDPNVYRANGRVWHRVGRITVETTRQDIEAYVAELKKVRP